MDEVQRFIDTWNGRSIDFDKSYGFHCMDVYQQYNRDVVGAFQVPNAAAYMVWNNYPTNFYTKIANAKDNAPQKGDVVIWKQTASLPFGHIAIANEGDPNRFSSMDQNWPLEGYTDKNGNFIGTGKCHIQEHKYTGVAGWLRPNKFIANVSEPVIVPVPTTQITDQTRIPQIDNKEVQAIKSELQATHDRVGQLDQQVSTLGQNLLLANSKYTDLKTEYEGYKAQNPPLAGLSLLELIQLYLKKKSG